MFAIKREARQLLRPVYWSALLVCLVAFVFYGYAANTGLGVPVTLSGALLLFVLPDSLLLQVLVIALPLQVFVAGPLSVARAHYFLRGIDGEWRLRHLLSPFLSRDYFRIVFVMGMRMLTLSIALQMFITDGSYAGTAFALVGVFLYYRQRLTPYLYG